MLEFEDTSKNTILTRFTGNKHDFDKDTQEVKASFFHSDTNMKNGEISVFDITEELLANNESAIYAIGDKKVFKKHPHTLARADISIEDIRNVKSSNGNLKVYRTLLSKHGNIRPYPNSRAEALNIAAKLSLISKLHIRKK